MKTKSNNYTNKRSRKVLVVVTIAVITVLISFSLILIYIYGLNGSLFGWKSSQNTTDYSSTNYGPATTEQKQAGVKTKSSTTSDTPPTLTKITGSDKKNTEVTISAINQNSSTLQIRVLISAVEDTGVCAITLTSTRQSAVTATANTQALASASTCKGFDIPLSKLAAGSWHILIEYSSPVLTGSTSQDMVIK